MSESSKPCGPHASTIVCRAEQLEYVSERLEEVRRLCGIGQDFAVLGNEAGLRYALKEAIRKFRDACATFKEAPEPREAS